MRVVFIRQAQSTGNIGVPRDDLSQLELTEQGRQQAMELSTAWMKPPTFIVTSPYLRTRQRARSTIERYPDVPVEIWPIHEFTYLEPTCWNGTLPACRPHVDAYWNTADPEYVTIPMLRALLPRYDSSREPLSCGCQIDLRRRST